MHPSTRAAPQPDTRPRHGSAPEPTLYLRDVDLIRRTVSENTKRLQAAVDDLVARKDRACWSYSPETHDALLKAIASERRVIEFVDADLI